ncbi:MAG: hypothetical protein KAH21_07405, partial [Spirochaetaceae bacterium]|nr:hypothetical protein [Spirochaetaceae bacterium]
MGIISRKERLVSDSSPEQSELDLQEAKSSASKIVKRVRKKAIVIKATTQDGMNPEDNLPSDDKPDKPDTAETPVEAQTNPEGSGESADSSESSGKIKVRKKASADNDTGSSKVPAAAEEPVNDEPEKEKPQEQDPSRGRRRGKKGGNRSIKGPKHDPDAPKLQINDLSVNTMPQLRETAEDLG